MLRTRWATSCGSTAPWPCPCPGAPGGPGGPIRILLTSSPAQLRRRSQRVSRTLSMRTHCYFVKGTTRSYFVKELKSTGSGPAFLEYHIHCQFVYLHSLCIMDMMSLMDGPLPPPGGPGVPGNPGAPGGPGGPGRPAPAPAPNGPQ